MLKITLITLGKLKEKYLAEAANEYIKRLGGLCGFSLIELEPVRLPEKPSNSQITAALEVEGKKIIAKIPSGAAIIPLCIEGRQMSSEELSKTLENLTAVYGRVVFIIGSSYGLCDEVKSLGKMGISMSAMTFPHQLARVMLLEQIYRALKISCGGTYHK